MNNVMLLGKFISVTKSNNQTSYINISISDKTIPVTLEEEGQSIDIGDDYTYTYDNGTLTLDKYVGTTNTDITTPHLNGQ